MKTKQPIKKRWSITAKEALIGLGIVVIHFCLWFGFAYGLGSGPPSEYQYIVGLPAWFFFSCIVVPIFIIILVSLAVRFFFTDISLEEEEEKR